MPSSPSSSFPPPSARPDCAVDLVQLGVWYVRHLLATGRIRPGAVEDALTRRVNLYRLTSLWDGVHDPALGHGDPRWRPLVSVLAGFVRDAALDEVALEQRALALLRPLLRNEPEAPPPRAIGCWSCGLVGDGIAEAAAGARAGHVQRLARGLRRRLGLPLPLRHVELHFHNACAPRSPFADARALARDLHELLVATRQQAPLVRTVWCNTWLNARDEFVSLFPPQWRRSATPRSPEDVLRTSQGPARLNTRNWWGQFVRSDGSFHVERAVRFRQTGQFPHPNLLCHASLDDVLAHLQQQLAAPHGLVDGGVGA